MTLNYSPNWLRARAQATPRALALLSGENRWSYGELDKEVDAVCGWLQSLDLPANRRIGMLLPNSPAAVFLVHACVRLGLTLIPFNTRLTPAELEEQITFTACRLIITEEHVSMSANQHFSLSAYQPVSLSANQLQVALFPRLLPTDRQTLPPDPRSPIPDPQSIVFTSGTSGRPKAVPISLEQHFYSALGSAFRLGVGPDDLWLSVLPLYHVGGLAVLFRSVLYGTAVDLHPRFDLDTVNRALDTKPITLISLVPTMLYRLLASRQRWPDSLRLVLMGGAATTPELVAAAAAQGLDLAVSYGMTEAASQIATLMPAGVKEKPGCVGRPLLFTELRLQNDSGQEPEPGEYGEISVRGPVVTRGYLDNPAANAERFDKDGWFRTGDIGYLDEDGELWLVQRRSDLIVSGGENVYPAEVEAVLRGHPAVQEACVVGVPDPEWGQRVAAMIALRPAAELSEAALLAFARERLAGYKLPRLVRFVSELPQTASGKIAREAVENAFR